MLYRFCNTTYVISMDLNRKKSFIPLIYHQIQEKEPSHTNGFQGQWKSIANILHSLRLFAVRSIGKYIETIQYQ